MTVWRPPSEIKVKVVGLVWRDAELLLAEVENDLGDVKGVRPLGGSVEFGETREAALAREFAEELDCGITLAGPWHGFENIYEHEGAVGHEYIFAANVQLDDAHLYQRSAIDFVEPNLIACRAAWFTPGALPDGVDLYPAALFSLIEAGTVSPKG